MVPFPIQLGRLENIHCTPPSCLHSLMLTHPFAVSCPRCLRFLLFLRTVCSDACDVHARFCIVSDGLPWLRRIRGLARRRGGGMLLRGHNHVAAIPCLWRTLVRQKSYRRRQGEQGRYGDGGSKNDSDINSMTV